jgi:hypothetical protein
MISMEGQEFVNAIKLAVRDAAISGALSLLERPPGRQPSASLLENADWYASLSESERQKLLNIIQGAVDQAVFGFLCVIDGVRAIEDGAEKGRLELRHINEKETLLNPPEGAMLHDLY